MSRNSALRVLAIDDDRASLKILSRQLQRCGYKVTSTTTAAKALEMLRQNKDNYDIVITDIIMPDMDGFKLLEIIRFDIDVPVIMISTDNDVKNVVRGIKSGAQDYFLKPVQLDDLKNIGGYVVKKPEAQEKSHDDDATDDYEPETNQESDRKYKKRIVWNDGLHKKFMDAIEQLEARDSKKVIPTKILELMNEPGLTRENVGSHLQKYRKALAKKREKEKEDNVLIQAAISASIHNHGHSPINFSNSNMQYDHFGAGTSRLNTPTRISAKPGIPSPYPTNTDFPNPQILNSMHPVAMSRPLIPLLQEKNSSPYDQFQNTFTSNYQMHGGYPTQMVFNPSPLQLALGHHGEQNLMLTNGENSDNTMNDIYMNELGGTGQNNLMHLLQENPDREAIDRRSSLSNILFDDELRALIDGYDAVPIMIDASDIHVQFKAK